MNIPEIEKISSEYIEQLASLLNQDGYVLTDISFYKGAEGMAHVEIKAKRKCSVENRPMWWVCALPLTISNDNMLPSQVVLQDG